MWSTAREIAAGDVVIFWLVEAFFFTQNYQLMATSAD
jgi:hypothetical protein